MIQLTTIKTNGEHENIFCTEAYVIIHPPELDKKPCVKLLRYTKNGTTDFISLADLVSIKEVKPNIGEISQKK